jgi:DNA ligase (NAD+)
MITGTLSQCSREEAKRQIEERGGKVASAISKSVDYLVVGEAPGSKLAKAQQLGIPLLSEADFISMVK